MLHDSAPTLTSTTRLCHGVYGVAVAFQAVLTIVRVMNPSLSELRRFRWAPHLILRREKCWSNNFDHILRVRNCRIEIFTGLKQLVYLFSIFFLITIFYEYIKFWAIS